MVRELDRRDPRIDARSRPCRARWHEYIIVHRHVGVKIVERDAVVASRRVWCGSVPDPPQLSHPVGHALFAHPFGGLRIIGERVDHLLKGFAGATKCDPFAPSGSRTRIVATVAGSAVFICRRDYSSEMLERLPVEPGEPRGLTGPQLIGDGKVAESAVKLDAGAVICLWPLPGNGAARPPFLRVGDAEQLQKRADVFVCQPEESFDAGSRRRAFRVGIERGEDRFGPRRQAAGSGETAVEITPGQEEIGAVIAELIADTTTVTVGDAPGHVGRVVAGEPGRRVIGLGWFIGCAVWHFCELVTALFVSPSDPSLLECEGVEDADHTTNHRRQRDRHGARRE